MIVEEMAKDFKVALYIGMFIGEIHNRNILSEQDIIKLHSFGQLLCQEAGELIDREESQN